MKSIATNSPTQQADTVVGSSEPDVVRLASLIRAYAPHDGRFELRIPGAYAIRVSRVNPDLVHALQRPALCIVAQGAKTVLLGEEVYEYDASRMLVYSVDLPVAAQVTRASASEPYLSFKLDLDPHKIAELVLKVYPHGLPRAQESRAVYVGQADMRIVNAATRLLELMAQQGDAELLAPLAVEEILIRLLRSPIGVRVAQIGLTESSVHGVAKAVSWLRANFSQAMKVEELAKLAHMSVSSFHQHFKAVTSMSPLQFQKVLRLQEARRLMLSMMVDAGTASWRVGYQSASQFSREYGRFFGRAPTKDIASLREHPDVDLTQVTV
ncbi:MAG TPA: AraC family transcriptional regulator [Candidatus Methylomirabilis sp.]|nr:AraC family transcriptional regulator [Candidatus Methylomirabilis sp.]